MNVKPIRSEIDLQNAVLRFEAIMFASAGTPEYDEMEVLGVLIEDYERRHYPIGPPSPVEAIRFALAERGMKPVDLIPVIGGSKGRIYEVLAGKRKLSIEMIRRLSTALSIPAEILLGLGETQPSARYERPASVPSVVRETRKTEDKNG